MKTYMFAALVAVLGMILPTDSECLAFGRGGRGGGGGGGGGRSVGGGGGGGGGGVSRPSPAARPSGGSSPSFNRPSSGPSSPGASRPATPSTRPGSGAGLNAGSRPSTLPGTVPGSQPGTGAGLNAGSRPSTLPGAVPGTRPGTGAGLNAGSRPSTLPGTVPGTRPGTGAGLNAGSRPSTLPGTVPGTRPGTGVAVGNRPGGGSIGTNINNNNIANINNNQAININNNNVAISQRPAQLPGFGTGAAAVNRPGNVPDRMANRPQTLEGRRSDLSNRMTTGREDWQSHRGDMQDDRQDWRNNNREDWQDFAHDYHGGWYNGSWDPGNGWNYMWDNYPAAAAIGVTRWGVNRIAFGFGYWGYQNPYYVASSSTSYSYNYSQPLVVYNESASPEAAPADPAAQTAATSGPPQPTDAGMAAFDESRSAFYSGNYPEALAQLDVTLQTMPRDPVVHEFRGLVLFAMQKYPESSAAVYAVLSAGPGWDWTTMSGLYPSVDVYTQQLRELENFVKENPQSADGTFLLGYHYLTMGHKEAATPYFSMALKQLPGDKLLAQLVDMTTPQDQNAQKTPPAPPAPGDLPAEKILTMEKLTGTWKASSQDAQFELQLNADGTFVWSFARGDSKESVQGVFALDQNNLAMEPNTGGTMLAEVDLMSPSEFGFRMVGGGVTDPGLMFKKN